MQHLTDKEIGIIMYFYKHKFGHVRQIKKITKMHEHTLLKYLKKLENRKILSSKKEGNLKIFDINTKNHLTNIFFSYFDILRLNELEYKRRKAIEEFLDRIKEIKLPYFIILFGSTSKENYTKTSDIDIIIVYDNYNSLNHKIDKIAKDLYAETSLKINFILMRLEEFMKEKDNKKNYALRDALETGYPILGNNLFYEAVL